MILLLTGLLACLLPAALSQSDSGGYYPQGQQSGGFYPSPMKGAPYPAATPMAPATPNSPETYSAPTGQGTGPSGGGYSSPFFSPAASSAFIGLTPICAKFAIAYTRLHSLLEPIKVLVVGAFVFFAIKNYVIPYLVHYSRAVEEEDGLERSLGKNKPLDPVTLNILRAVSRGVCLEHIACQLGKKAKEYPITKEVVRAIDSAGGAEERLLSVFRAAVTDDTDNTSCDVYRCNKKRAFKKKYKITPSKRLSHPT